MKITKNYLKQIIKEELQKEAGGLEGVAKMQAAQKPQIAKGDHELREEEANKIRAIVKQLNSQLMNKYEIFISRNGQRILITDRKTSAIVSFEPQVDHLAERPD